MSIDLRTCDPNALPASAELNALMATGVMDKTLLTEQEMQTEAERVWKHQPQCVHFGMGFSAWKDGNARKFDHHIPPYSTNPAHAGELRRTHFGDGFYWELASDSRGIGCRLYTEGAQFDSHCYYSSVGGDPARAEALAICRAFAAWLKVKHQTAQGAEGGDE